MSKVTPFLWFDTQAKEAAEFYVAIFKGINWEGAVHFTSPTMNVFELDGQKFMALNAGPEYKFNESISMYVECSNQAEVDYFWDKLSNGGVPGQCGWLKDKFGLSWQIIPKQLGELMMGDDKDKAARVMAAMMNMTKIEIETLVKS